MSPTDPRSRHRSRSTSRGPVHRISGPPELLQAVPYLLGFHPRRSLVLVGLHLGMLVVTARLDLDGADQPGLVADTVAAMSVGGATSLIAAVYDDDARPFEVIAASGEDLAWSHVVALLGLAADRCGMDVGDVVAVRGQRWCSYLCGPYDCCPPDGRELPDTTSTFAAEAILAGRAPLADRTAVQATLEPLPVPEPALLARRLADSENAAVAAVLSGGGTRHRRSEVRALFAAARASDAVGWGGLPIPDAGRFGAALSRIEVRDAVWMGVDDGRIDGRALWRDLGRTLPEPYSAAPLFVFAWASWRAGDGALAGMAAERAIDSDPTYSAADLLLAALSQGIDPRRLPKLRRTA